MLFLLLGSLALWLFWFLVGRLALSALATTSDPEPESTESTMLLGAFVLAVAAQGVHFFVALPSAAAAAAVAAVFVVCLLVRRRDARWVFDQLRLAVRNHPVLAASFVASAIVVALAAARPCRVEDTENYHAQVLRWTEAARLVPGLALVHGRLGFNSLWFPLEALFSFAFLSNGPMPLVNTATFLLGGLSLFRHALSAAPPSLRANLALAALVPYFAVGFIFAGSQSPDLPALTYGLLAFFAVSLAFASRRREHYVLALCLSCAAAAWKLSSAPILLFVPIILGHWWTTPSRSLFAISRALGFVVLSGLLFVARSVVLSGYALFPSTAFDVFPVSWKAPELARGQQTWVLLFARGFRREDPAQALTYPLARWLPIWIHGLNSPSRIVVGLLGAGLLLLPVALVVRRLRKPFARDARSALAAMAIVAVAGLVFWLWQAPDVRFGASYLTALIALAYVPWLELVGSRPSMRPLVGSAVVLIAVAIVGQNVRFASPVPPWCPPEYVRAHPQRFYWLLPAPYPESSFVEERLRDGSVNYVVASGGLAHYGPVPNSPLPIAGIAVRRGPNLSDGYRVDGGQQLTPASQPSLSR